MTRSLSRRALQILLNGRFARIGGVTHRERARRLTTIASAYSRAELLNEHGVGAVTAREIELWLKEQGLDFRADHFKIPLIPPSVVSNAILD